jgi:phage gp46-like protein
MLHLLRHVRDAHNARMDPHLNPATGDYSGERINTLANAVYLRLRTPLGTWWADTSLGSRLHELERERDVMRVRRLAQQYAEQALQPLLDDGRARSIVVTTAHPRNSWLILNVWAVDQSGREARYEHPVRVA